MDLSDLGFNLLFDREGKRNVVYLDSQGIPTVGCGHTGPDVHMGDVWTDEQVWDAFRKDGAWVLAALALVTGHLSQNQFDALFSFIFNIGRGAWGSSTMLRMLNMTPPAPTAELAGQFDRWHIPPEIATRRNGEREQFKGTHFAARCDNQGKPLP